MTTPNALKRYKENMEALAFDAYKDHQIRRESEGRWLIQRKTAKGWEGFHWTEIIIIAGGIMVHGDGDSCIFKIYSPPEGEDDPIAAARWIARAPDQYAQEKANIGMDTSGVQGINNTFDDEVAVWELEGRVKERTAEITDEDGNIFSHIEVINGEIKVDEEYYECLAKESEDFDPVHEREQDLSEVSQCIQQGLEDDKELKAWQKAFEAMKQGWEDWYFVKNTLYDDLCDADVGDEGELISGIGIVPAPRLYYARAALRKFVELYDAKAKDATDDAA